MQDYSSLIKDSIPLFPFERGQKDGTGSNSTQFSKAKNVFLSGHSNGAINLWDVSCPNPLPIVSLTQQVILKSIFSFLLVNHDLSNNLVAAEPLLIFDRLQRCLCQEK